MLRAPLALAAVVLLPALLPAQALESEDLRQRYGARWTPEAEVYRSAAPSVVRVRLQARIDELVARVGPFEVGTGERWPNLSTGTGVVYSEQGLVLTNAHVVRFRDDIDRADQRVRVEFAPEFSDDRGRTSYAASLVALDERLDLALLKIDAERSFPVVPFAEAGDLLIGERVIALGAPFGGSIGLSAGILSGLGRTVQVVDEGGSTRIMPGLIQTDAAINEGFSGGPLLNAYGELIGLTVSRVEDAEGIAYAIPVELIRESLESGLLGGGFATSFWAGMEVAPAAPEAWPRIGAVHPRGPAALAGLQPGDRILTVDRRPVGTFQSWASELLGHEAGDTLELVVRRGREAVGTSLTLAPPEQRDGYALLGVELERGRFPYRSPDDGALVYLDCPRVTRVYPESPAAELGLRPGDLILMVGVDDARYPSGWAKARSAGELLALVRGPSFRLAGDNLWIAREDDTLKGRLELDDPGLLRRRARAAQTAAEDARASEPAKARNSSSSADGSTVGPSSSAGDSSRN